RQAAEAVRHAHSSSTPRGTSRRSGSPLMQVRSAVRQARFIARALRDERRSAAEVQRLQDARLRWMVKHAVAHSRFYQAKFKAAGLRAADIRTVADLVHLPPTTRAELREAGPELMLANGYSASNSVHEATSGSSGVVLHLRHSLSAYDRYFAFAFRH